MFGTCAPSFGSGLFGKGGRRSGSGEIDDPRLPKRYEGQRRELIVKQAEQVSEWRLRADIDEIEKALEDEEREYEAGAVERQEQLRRKEEEMKQEAVTKAISAASGQLSGSLLDRLQGLAKLKEAATSVVFSEFTQIKAAGQSSPGNRVLAGGSGGGADPDMLKMPVPEAPLVIVKVTHPCYVSVLRAKLHRTLDIPLEDIRIVHRSRALRDNDVVPSDTVDLGEQDIVDDVSIEEGALDLLSYLWMVDARTLEQPPLPPSPSSTVERRSKGNKKATNANSRSDRDHGGDGGSPCSVGAERAGAEDEEEEEEKGEDVGGEGATQATSPVSHDITGGDNDDNTKRKQGKKGDDTCRADTLPDEQKRPVPMAGAGADDDEDGRSHASGPSVDLPGDGGAGEAGLVVATSPSKGGFPARVSAGVAAVSRLGDEEKTTGRGSSAATAEVAALPQMEQKKKKKKRMIPGSLLLSKISASDLPDTEKGIFSKQDPYLVIKWAQQEARTTVRRDSGKDCSWLKEELVLLVRATKQLKKSVLVEVWNDNAGDNKPSPDVLIGKGSFPVEHLALPVPASIGGRGNVGGGGGGGDAGDDAGEEERQKMGRVREEEQAGSKAAVITVSLTPDDEGQRKRSKKAGGAVTLVLSYTPPREKHQSKRKKQETPVTVSAQDDNHDEDDDPHETEEDSLASIADWSSQDERALLPVQELGAVISQALEGFDIREELSMIDCSRYAAGLIKEGFGQRGAFANVQEEHMAGYPMFIPRGARKRLLALSELIRLQMKAEENKATTGMETLNAEGGVDTLYTTDGSKFFDTRAAMKAAAELRQAEGGEEQQDFPTQRQQPKPRSAAKAKVIRAIEAAAAADERGGTSRKFANRHRHRQHKPGDGGDGRGGRGEDGELCCEKHAFRIERSAIRMVEERLKDTSNKVNTWLDQADRFKNGAISRPVVRKVMRDAFLHSGLSSPRESDVTLSLARASRDNHGLQFDRGKVALELEKVVRRELCLKSGVPPIENIRGYPRR